MAAARSPVEVASGVGETDYGRSSGLTRSVGEFRVAQVSTADESGGAARAAMRLHEALRMDGVDSEFLVARRTGRDGATAVRECHPLEPLPRVWGDLYFRAARRFHHPSVRREGAYFSREWTLTGWALPRQLPPCDVVNLHWVVDWLDYRTLPAIQRLAPVVWTFHDMTALTGGCHYSGECERFVADGCGSCPQLRSSRGRNDFTRKVFQRKERIGAGIDPRRMTVVCPSEWLAGETRRSRLFGHFDVRVVPNGIDLVAFRPEGRQDARDRLGIGRDERVVLFVADFLEDRRKGLAHLVEALRTISVPNLRLVTMGRSVPAGLENCLHLGMLGSAQELRTAYSAADVFAIPSLQDNLPNTVLEAMACGTPVVGFAAGGIAESVDDGQTGMLAPVGDNVGLADRLQRILERPEWAREMGERSRRRAVALYGQERQARRYREVYAEAVEKAVRP